MKKVLLLTIMLTAAFSLFAKEKKIKFNSASLNSTSKCARLAKKAFNDGFSVLKPEANLTIWKKDSENFIYCFEDGKRGENRSIHSYAKIDGKVEFFSAFVQHISGEQNDQFIVLNKEKDNVSMSSIIEELSELTQNKDLPTKKEYAEILAKDQLNIFRNTYHNYIQ